MCIAKGYNESSELKNSSPILATTPPQINNIFPIEGDNSPTKHPAPIKVPIKATIGLAMTFKGKNQIGN